jgi:hypothetical protein
MEADRRTSLGILSDNFRTFLGLVYDSYILSGRGSIYTDNRKLSLTGEGKEDFYSSNKSSFTSESKSAFYADDEETSLTGEGLV